MTKQVIHTNNAPAAIGPYSQAIRAGNTIYISGQIPLNPLTMEMNNATFNDEVHQVFKNLQAICEAAGGSFDNIVKVNLFLTDLSHFATVNQLMQEYFRTPFPARAAIEVKGLPRGANFEAEAIMVLS
jgi:reactive intermediate/imine deaminase